jgi:hypothetical protein
MKKLSRPIYVTEVQVKEVTAPSTPPSGYVHIYAKADGKLYIKDDTGVETDLTATGAGGGGVTSINTQTGAVSLTGVDAGGGGVNIPLFYQNVATTATDFEIQIKAITSSNGSVGISDSGNVIDLTAATIDSIIPDGDKGDITTSAGGTSWVIDNNAVTAGKLEAGVAVDIDLVHSQVYLNAF